MLIIRRSLLFILILILYQIGAAKITSVSAAAISDSDANLEFVGVGVQFNCYRELEAFEIRLFDAWNPFSYYLPSSIDLEALERESNLFFEKNFHPDPMGGPVFHIFECQLKDHNYSIHLSISRGGSIRCSGAGIVQFEIKNEENILIPNSYFPDQCNDLISINSVLFFPKKNEYMIEGVDLTYTKSTHELFFTNRGRFEEIFKEEYEAKNRKPENNPASP